ncbi:MAG: sulfatase-like hydrolase/transferase [Dehalococcoidia bacterium]
MNRLSRRRLIRAGGGLAAAAAAHAARTSTVAGMAGSDRPDGWHPNLIVLLTDQWRFTQHWPDGWAEQHLPAEERLKRHGLTFRNAFIAAAECTPSRATILTGTYPAVNGVTTTFDTSHTGVGTILQTFQTNLARLLTSAGYDVVYKGKWHESWPVGYTWSERDIPALAERYGVGEWNPPDAGNSLSAASTAGGGAPNNDGRFMSGPTPGATGQTPGWGESVIDFLGKRRPSDRPFCLFVSLVNPHDIGLYPNGWQEAGYQLPAFENLGVDLPANLQDSLDTKPSVQAQFRSFWNQSQPLQGEADERAYVNFYAYLHTVVDQHITTMLDALDASGLTNDTVIIRLADHGETGLSHGLRQKMYNAYDETIHVPLIVSNPVLYNEPVETEAFASLIDIVPTIAGIAGVPPDELRRAGCVGVDLAPVLSDPAARVRDVALFTYDDHTPGIPIDAIKHICAVREARWLYAVYYSMDGSTLQYEMYDLERDPLEMENLAFEPSAPGTSIDAERQRLHRRLTDELVAANALPRSFRWPARSGPATAGMKNE